MATKNAGLRDALADAFGNLWDQGGNPNPSKLEIRDASAVLLVQFDLNTDAFAAASAGQVTLNGLPISATAVASGVASKAHLISADGTSYSINDMTVGTSGTQVIIDNTSINSGQTVNLTGFTWTEASTIA